MDSTRRSYAKSNPERDRFYLISDVDHFYNDLVRIAPMCAAEDFNLIMSNSCFEVWLYYAYFDTIPTFTVPDNPLKISGKFKGWISQVIPGGIQTNETILL